MRFTAVIGLGLAVAAALVGCGEDTREPSVLRVPEDHPSIQLAVSVAEPGDLVLVDTGTYTESITVVTPGITIRGVDRNGVVLDGAHELANGIEVWVDGVAIENLTIRNYVDDGVVFDGSAGDRQPDSEGAFGSEDASLIGYRIAYVTVSNNGQHGIRAFASRDGLIDESYASGNPIAGIRIDQCGPCNTVVRHSIGERNGVGFLGTNASGSLFVVDGTYRSNRVGMSAASQEALHLAPQAGSVFAGNLVVDNDDPGAPAGLLGIFGGGIAVAGGTDNSITHNRVSGNDLFGVGLVPREGFSPIGNRIESNVLSGNGVDIYYELPTGAVATYDNCFAVNSFTVSVPEQVENLLPCDAPASPVVPGVLSVPEPPPDVDHRTVPLPAPQTSMTGDLTVPPESRAQRAPDPDLDSIQVPAGD